MIEEYPQSEGAYVRDTTKTGEANLTARCPISLAIRQIVGCAEKRAGICLCGPNESFEIESHFPDDHRLVKRTRENRRQFCFGFVVRLFKDCRVIVSNSTRLISDLGMKIACHNKLFEICNIRKCFCK